MEGRANGVKHQFSMYMDMEEDSGSYMAFPGWFVDRCARGPSADITDCAKTQFHLCTLGPRPDY